MRKRILSMVFAVMLIVTILPTTALAEEDNPFSDIADHWAESVILEDHAKGLVKGMSDGTFKPDDSLTNAQLITLVNRFFGLTKGEDNQFADVKGDEWYAGEADKAEYYSYVDNAALKGDTPILRLDMLWILDSMLHVEETDVEAPFDDLDGLSGEELDIVNRFYARGYLEGDGQGNATLGQGLTRAQVLTFFGNTLGYIVLTQDDVANIPENGKVTVIGQNIVIEDKTIDELFISPGVYGDVTVKNTVLKNATLGGEGTDGAVIFDNITVRGELIVQDGDVDLTGTNIKKVTIRGESKINTDKDTAITSLEVNAPVTITGGGKITEAEITVDGAAIEKKPTYYVVKNGVTADVGGDKITYTNDRPRPSGGTAAPISPAQVTQVKLVDGTWVADASGTHTGIWTIEDLALVGSETTTDDSVWELGDDYVLMNDLDFNADASYQDAAANKLTYTDTAGSGFTPIGNHTNYFAGSFDGNNKIIANLYINRSGSDYIGLFGVTDGATIKNIGLTGVNVTGNNSVGGLVGSANYGNITDSYATGAVSGAYSVGGLVGCASSYIYITDSYATGTVTGTGNNVGGLVGLAENYSSITNSYATGTVTGTSNRVGGLVGGTSFCNITDSYATGSVTGTNYVGGLVGFADNSSITNCIAFNPSVSVSESSVANHRILSDMYHSSTQTGNYAKGTMTVTVGVNTTTPTSDADGLDGANMTSAEFGDSSSTPYSSLNWDFTNTWEIKAGADRPTLQGVDTDSGALVLVTSIAVKTAPTKVTYDAGDSLDLAGLVITLTNNDSSTEDVEAAAFSSKGITSDPVDGATLGLADTVITISFDGMSTTQDITVMPVQSEQVSYNSSSGMWEIDAAGTHTGIWKIEDLALVGSDTTNDDSSGWELNDDYVLMNGLDFNSDANYQDAANKSTYTNTAGSGFAPIGNDSNFFTGSFDGNNNTIANLYIDRDTNNIGLFGYTNGATLKNVSLTGVNITGADNVGGLVGYTYTSSSITNSYATGDVSGEDYVGGLVGHTYTSSSITNSYATGDVSGEAYVGGLVGFASGSSITNSYATGDVSGTYDYVGGLIGEADYSFITNCYAEGSVSGNIEIGGLVGWAFDNSITNSYATGSVSGSDKVGGLVGSACERSSITNSYATGSVSGNDSVGGLVGYAYNDNSITNSIAFNPGVSGSTNVNRVLGNDGSTTTLSGNYAYEAMTVTVDGSTTAPTSDADGLDGADMTGAAFGDSASAPYSVSWDFTVDSSTGGSTADNDGYYWMMGPNRPILYFFDGTSSAQIGTDSGVGPDVTAPTISTYFPADDAADVAQTTTAFTATFSEDVVKGTGDIVIKKSADNSTVFTIAVADVAISGSAVTISLPSGSNLEYTTGYYIEIPATAFTDTSGNAFAGIADSSTWSFTVPIPLGAQVSYNSASGTWVANANGTATGIWTIEDLVLVGSETTNGSGVWELSDSYVLMTNLDFTSDASYRDAAGLDTNDVDGDGDATETLKNALISTDGGSGFTPIGDSTNRFTGSFDGNNNTIANVYINRSGSDNIGLISKASNAMIKNIGLTDVNVTGSGYVGGLVGETHGGTTTSCYVTGSVTGTDNCVGGLVGRVNGNSITNSYAAVSVSGTVGAGGLVGLSLGSITNCYATGSVTGTSDVGGLVGSAYGGSIANSYATGSVTVSSSNVGGLVGSADNSCSITNCIAFNFGVSGSWDVNRVLGCDIFTNTTLTGNYAYEAMTVTVDGSTTTPTSDADGLDGADMTGVALGDSASAPYDGNWDFTADTITGGGTADDDGYYWQMGPNRPVLYFFDGTNHVQIGDDGGSMA